MVLAAPAGTGSTTRSSHSVPVPISRFFLILVPSATLRLCVKLLPHSRTPSRPLPLLAGGLLAPGVVVGFAGLAVAMPRTTRPGAGTIGIDLLLIHFGTPIGFAVSRRGAYVAPEPIRAGREKYSSRAMPSPPTSRLRCGLNVRAKAAVPGCATGARP